MSKRLVSQTLSPAADLPPGDLLLDIFLLLPPAPSHLFTASLVCKRWRRLIRNPDFLRRFRAFHRATPVLGLYQNIGWLIRFVPIAAPAPRLSAPQDFHNGPCWVLDCRHGRVLIFDHSHRSLFVWDPMTDKWFEVPLPDLLSEQESFTAALVCAPGHDDHTDCHSTSYRIVYVNNSADDELQVSACVFSSESSETDKWGGWTSITPPSLVSTDWAAAVVGSSVYWKLDFDSNSNHILGFAFERKTQELFDLIELPTRVQGKYMSGIHVMPAEDGGIGFAGVNQFDLHFWSWKTDREDEAGWALIRIIDMKILTISDTLAGDVLSWSSVVGFADDSDVLFLHSEAGVFMINLVSKQLKKVPQASASAVYPYTSFYTRGDDIVSIDVKDDKSGIKVLKEEEAGSSSGGGHG